MMYSAQYASGRKSEHKLIGDTVHEDEDIDNEIEGFYQKLTKDFCKRLLDSEK
jgi:hypothetical protein